MTTPPIIDSHVHIGTGDGLTGPWDTRASLDTYWSRARPAGITRAVLMPPLTSDYPRANDEIGTIVRARPDRFLGFCFVNAVTEQGAIGHAVARCVRNWGCCGIKVHARDGRITREIAEAARRWQLPVLYDPMGDLASVEMVVGEYADVAWIVPHLSSFADDWKAQVAFVDKLCRLPNLFTDTSGVRYFDVLDDAVRRAGPAKVLFGSDGPFLHPGVELAKARFACPDAESAALVLGGNLLRLTAAARRRTRRGAR
jgi:predicted TIM-barrel fold metal-dependent hydrolase